MEVHPGVHARSFRAFETRMAFFPGGTTRRKKPPPSSRAAAAAAAGGGGDGGGGSSTTVGGEEDAVAPAIFTTSRASSGSLFQQAQPLSVDAGSVRVGDETGTGGRSRENVEAVASAAAVAATGSATATTTTAETAADCGAFRQTRVFSDPGDSREVMSDSSLGFGAEISSLQGITMDVVHGTVRFKAPPFVVVMHGAAADGFDGSPNGMASMVDLAAAVDEAAATEATVSPTASPAASPVRSSAGSPRADDTVERTYRASSSVVGLTEFMVGGSQGPSKRAKSGATLFKVDGSNGAPPSMSAGVGQMGWTTANQINPTQGNVASINVASGPAVASRDGGLGAVSGAAGASEEAANSASNIAVEGGGKAGTGGSGGGGNEEGVAPATNEAWLALLTPLLLAVPAGTHPEDFLHDILRERGYSTEMVAVKETIFHLAPAPEQVAAYDKAILSAVLDEDEAVLERMRASGRRMDACNRFGDSVLHMACRRGRVGALRYFLRVCGPKGVVLSDDYGRTVMHDACWTASPRFDVASSVLDVDTRLLRMVDSRGSSPLQYVPQDQWPLWCAFFESRKEVYWPRLAPGEQDVAGVIPRSA